MTIFTPYAERFATFAANTMAPDGNRRKIKSLAANVKILACNVSAVALIAIAAVAILKSSWLLFTFAALSGLTHYAFHHEAPAATSRNATTVAVWRNFERPPAADDDRPLAAVAEMEHRGSGGGSVGYMETGSHHEGAGGGGFGGGSVGYMGGPHG